MLCVATHIWQSFPTTLSISRSSFLWIAVLRWQFRFVDQEHRVVVVVLSEVEIKKQVDHLLLARRQEVKLERFLLVSPCEVQRPPAVLHHAEVVNLDVEARLQRPIEFVDHVTLGFARLHIFLVPVPAVLGLQPPVVDLHLGVYADRRGGTVLVVADVCDRPYLVDLHFGVVPIRAPEGEQGVSFGRTTPPYLPEAPGRERHVDPVYVVVRVLVQRVIPVVAPSRLAYTNMGALQEQERVEHAALPAAVRADQRHDPRRIVAEINRQVLEPLVSLQ